MMNLNNRRTGFTLVEMLVVIAILMVVSSMLLAVVGNSRRTARDVQCMNNLRQLGLAAELYANEHSGHLPPLAYTRRWPPVYWWGTNEESPDFSKGFLAPYIGEAGELKSVYQCPAQPPGSYKAEGMGGAITTTYGYNGYYLCPEATPGWSYSIRQQPWQTLQEVLTPSQTIMFGDALLDWGKGVVTNTSLIDPPFTYSRGRWKKNDRPTTCFRHDGKTNICFVDGHVEGIDSGQGTLTSPEHKIGYIGDDNSAYVPDYEEW